MCLLITKTQNAPKLSDHWLKDFYQFNSDGIGVMYSKHDQLIVKKLLPKSEDELIDFYRAEVDGKKCAIHFRMRTHGEIDLFNCHPYEVLNQSDHGVDLWLMHNGVLSTGNKSDPSKSDTYHYIKDYLIPMLSSNPDFAFTDQFRAIVGSHIGSSNKFVLMDSKGRLSTVNQSSGVYWAGMWLSNTYAWTAPDDTSKQWIKDHKLWKKQSQSKIVKKSYKFKNYSFDYEDYDSYGVNTKNSFNTNPSYLSDSDIDEIESCMNDLAYCGFDNVIDLTFDQIEDFIFANRVSGFYDLYDSLINYEITEDIFINLICNPNQYRKHINTTQGILL